MPEETKAPSVPMNTREVPSMGIKAKILEYATPEDLDKEAGVKGRTLALANKYLGEKVALVNFRAAFVVHMVKTFPKFDFPHDIVEVAGEEGKPPTQKKVLKSEVRCVNAFRNACATGKIVDWPKEKEAINGKLQIIANALGAFKGDAKKQLRIPSPKALPKYALQGAENIIANKSEAKWVKTFTNEGILFEDFQTKDAAVNATNLARAIKAREDAKSGKEYA